MTKAVAKAAAAAVVNYYQDAPSAVKLIDNVILAVGKLNVHLHQAACVATYHAWKHGNPDMLTRLWAGLEKHKRVNDCDALRLWIGQVSTVTIPQDEGSEILYSWANWNNKEKKFLVKTKSQAMREMQSGLFGDGEGLLERLTPFWEVQTAKASKALTFEQLMQMIVGFKARADKAAEKDSLSIPRDVEVELDRLATVANRFLAVETPEQAAA